MDTGQFATFDEFVEALDALMARTRDLDQGELIAELEGRIQGLHDDYGE